MRSRTLRVPSECPGCLHLLRPRSRPQHRHLYPSRSFCVVVAAVVAAVVALTVCPGAWLLLPWPTPLSWPFSPVLGDAVDAAIHRLIRPATTVGFLFAPVLGFHSLSLLLCCCCCCCCCCSFLNDTLSPYHIRDSRNSSSTAAKLTDRLTREQRERKGDRARETNWISVAKILFHVHSVCVRVCVCVCLNEWASAGVSVWKGGRESGSV